MRSNRQGGYREIFDRAMISLTNEREASTQRPDARFRPSNGVWPLSSLGREGRGNTLRFRLSTPPDAKFRLSFAPVMASQDPPGPKGTHGLQRLNFGSLSPPPLSPPPPPQRRLTILRPSLAVLRPIGTWSPIRIQCATDLETSSKGSSCW
jgi:hypothetical protein